MASQFHEHDASDSAFQSQYELVHKRKEDPLLSSIVGEIHRSKPMSSVAHPKALAVSTSKQASMSPQSLIPTVREKIKRLKCELISMQRANDILRANLRLQKTQSPCRPWSQNATTAELHRLQEQVGYVRYENVLLQQQLDRYLHTSHERTHIPISLWVIVSLFLVVKLTVLLSIWQESPY